jgi:hypothetical protein
MEQVLATIIAFALWGVPFIVAYCSFIEKATGHDWDGTDHTGMFI